jgi:hypothetical protein
MASSDQQHSVCRVEMHIRICFTRTQTGPKELKYVIRSFVVVTAIAQPLIHRQLVIYLMLFHLLCTALIILEAN